MTLLHYRESGQKAFECCDKRLVYYDYISCTETQETSLMECTICKKIYIEEVMLGRQYQKPVKSQKKPTSTGYPHFSTFNRD